MSWIDELKEGDKVIVSPMESYGHSTIGTVTRTTKTLIILSNDERFLKGSGHKSPSNRWNRRKLEPATEEALAKIERSDLAQKLMHTEWRKLPIATLRAVAELLKESQK